MGNNDNRVVTWSALNSFITQNGGSPKKSSGANSLALKYGEFSEYAPMATSTSSGVVVSDYTGIGGGAYTNNQLVIEKDVTWFNYVAPSILPTSISVTPDGTLTPGQTWQLTATVLPANADNKTVTWSSENTSIATVDQNGLVTAVSDGVVKIYATSNADPNVRGYATITVANAPVTRYNISWSSDHASIPGSTSPVTQNEGTSWNGTFVPENGYQIDSITYTGNNVQRDGNTVSVSNLTSDVVITITTSQISQPIEITLTAADVTVPVGQETNIYWALSDDSIDIQSVVYDIEDTDIAEMNEEEGYENFVKGLSRGVTNCTITVNGEYTATITITVVGLFDNSSLNGKTFLHDIFGNYMYNITDSANAFTGSNQPNEGTGYVSITNMSNSDMEWINNEGITTNVDWIPADQIQIEKIGNASSPYIVFKVQPYQEAIDALSDYASTKSLGIQSPLGLLPRGAEYVNGTVTEHISLIPREGIITLTAPDGSSAEIIIRQYGIIDCDANVRNNEWIELSSSHMSQISKPFEIQFFAPEGCTVTKHDVYTWYKIENFPWSSGMDPFFYVSYGTYNNVINFPDVLTTTGSGDVELPADFVQVAYSRGGVL